ncbi:sugar ABC transporter substrate-binding protein [Brucella gallinifaecis]|uniref:Sugar ABC transporter substrate-binding protein n=1 Tax=Brucella gallinifaecis TaxID=215590 RepID=A0A502BLL2_9HYPH|nr:sugar ABC transporter substrate-binding protein [Brucella gallinifaecis]TPF74268.1 sugar ABC transporter substrate-binding protein [Brucella gallinifaecis]
MNRLKKIALASAAACALMATPAAAKDIVGLITKTNINPFFVKMKEGAEAKAAELGVELRSFAGRIDGDNESQVEAIENLISAGAKGILITPNDSKGIISAVKKARDAGLIVIALDTPLDPIDAADATFATDNFKAGQLIGEWANKTLGDEAANARIAFLDVSKLGFTVDLLRDQGFMQGFGIDIKDPNIIGDEDDKRIVGHEATDGNEEGGRTGMENLLQRDPTLNVVYTIAEPVAAGAYEAIKAVGAEKGITITSIDGGCPGVENVRAGVIGATSMQFPLRMAELGVQAIVDYGKTGKLPENTPGLNFLDTGTQLVTDKPVEGLDSITSEEALKLCWG